MSAPRPFAWVSPVRRTLPRSFEVNCYDHGPVDDLVDGQAEMNPRRARAVRRQHLSDFHGRRWLWSDDDRRAWDER